MSASLRVQIPALAMYLFKRIPESPPPIGLVDGTGFFGPFGWETRCGVAEPALGETFFREGDLAIIFLAKVLVFYTKL